MPHHLRPLGRGVSGLLTHGRFMLTKCFFTLAERFVIGSHPRRVKKLAMAASAGALSTAVIPRWASVGGHGGPVQ